MLENIGDSEKKVTLDIESSGYISLNNYKYKTSLKSRELKYLFPIAVDKKINNNTTQQSVNIKYHIIFE